MEWSGVEWSGQEWSSLWWSRVELYRRSFRSETVTFCQCVLACRLLSLVLLECSKIDSK